MAPLSFVTGQAHRHTHTERHTRLCIFQPSAPSAWGLLPHSQRRNAWQYLGVWGPFSFLRFQALIFWDSRWSRDAVFTLILFCFSSLSLACARPPSQSSSYRTTHLGPAPVGLSYPQAHRVVVLFVTLQPRRWCSPQYHVKAAAHVIRPIHCFCHALNSSMIRPCSLPNQERPSSIVERCFP